jgi:hypothetical protein
MSIYFPARGQTKFPPETFFARFSRRIGREDVLAENNSRVVYGAVGKSRTFTEGVLTPFARGLSHGFNWQER